MKNANSIHTLCPIYIGLEIKQRKLEAYIHLPRILKANEEKIKFIQEISI